MEAKQTQETKHLKFPILQMPSIFSRIIYVHYILNLLLLYLVPKKLRTYLPCFSFLHKNQEQPISSTSPLSPSSPSPCKNNIHRKTMDAVELARVFDIFDHNGDGRITKKELKDSLESMGIFIEDMELDQMIEKIDINGDGCVDIGEFGSLYKSIMEDPERKGEGEEAGDEDMKEAFNVFDQNGDGFISVEELNSVLGSLGLKQGKDVGNCRDMIMKIDVDGNGMVDYNEFKKMMRRGGGDGFAAFS